MVRLGIKFTIFRFSFIFFFINLRNIFAFSFPLASKMNQKTILPYLEILKKEYKIILASGSPRRRELLNLMGISDFEVLVSNFPENLDINSFPQPQDYCLKTAQLKVHDVVKILGPRNDKVIVIGADTIVEINGHVLEKPKDEIDAQRMIKMLSGKQHSVHTGVTIFSNCLGDHPTSLIHHTTSFIETTKVDFAELSEEDILAYVATGEGKDKAGSYGIQGLGGQLVSGIHGCYFNVMGFPVHSLSRILSELVSQELTK